MIFVRLFLIFCKIGIFTFGGGYSMVALIQNEMVEKYHCGICINPHSVEDFKSAIQYLLTHKKEAYEMGQNGRRAVLVEYSWDSQYKRYLSIIEKLLQQ